MFDVPHRRFDSPNRNFESSFTERTVASDSEILHFQFSILNCEASAAWNSTARVEKAPSKPKPPVTPTEPSQPEEL